MFFVSYAQNFEDVMLFRALRHITEGCYIDVGAQDPIVDSVSLAFYERGWRGINVEPTPHYAELLRKHRPEDVVVEAAVGTRTGPLQFFEIPDTGISTADQNIAEQHKARGFTVREIRVPCKRLSAIFDTCTSQDIHWLKIDVEGLEKQVLQSWGKNPKRPWIVIVESTLPMTQIESHHEWEPALLSLGYTHAYFDGLNRYYVSNAHPELAGAFLTPPNVFDEFVLNGTSTATFLRHVSARFENEKRDLLADQDKKTRAAAMEISRLVEREKLLEGSLKELASSADQARLNEAQMRALNQDAILLREQLQQLARKNEFEIRRREADWREREEALIAKSSQLQQALEETHRSATLREQEASRQIMLSQQNFLLREQERDTREQQLADRLSALHTSMAQIESERSARERQTAANAQETQSRLQTLLQNAVNREQEFLLQIATIRHEATVKTADLARDFEERVLSIESESLKREQSLAQQLALARQDLSQNQQSSMLREVSLQSQISTLQRSLGALQHALQLQVQRHDYESTVIRQTYENRIAESSNSAARLAAVLRDEQGKNSELQNALVVEQRRLAMIYDSLLWRVTSPFRVFAKRLGNAAVGRGNVAAGSTAMAHSDTSIAATTSDIAGRAATLGELLSQNDLSFVQAAYQTLLGRDPDAPGLDHYVSRIRQGVPKIQILSELRSSAEARQIRAQVKYLDGAISLYKWLKVEIAT
jgi:FkbM family methyltransferase